MAQSPPPLITDKCHCVVKNIRHRLVFGWGQQYCGYCKLPIKWGHGSFDCFKRTDGRE